MRLAELRARAKIFAHERVVLECRKSIYFDRVHAALEEMVRVHSSPQKANVAFDATKRAAALLEEVDKGPS